MIAYDMGRMKNRTKDVQAKELINQYIKEICGNSPCLNNKTIKCSWVDALGASQKEYNTTVYKDYIVLNNERCNRATE